MSSKGVPSATDQQSYQEKTPGENPSACAAREQLHFSILRLNAKAPSIFKYTDSLCANMTLFLFSWPSGRADAVYDALQRGLILDDQCVSRDLQQLIPAEVRK